VTPGVILREDAHTILTIRDLLDDED